jgi:hypothetical protein
MIQAIIAVDNNDSILGNFFTECLQKIENYTNPLVQLDIIKSNALNDLTISLKVKNLSKIIFVAVSHGSEDSLLSNGVTPYISSNINIDKFSESFFYTCSCLTGKMLAPKLIENGCSSYLGYDNSFSVWDFNRTPFVECATYGYKVYLEGHNIETVLEMMKLKYDEHINNYDNDYFGAVMLLDNKNALIAQGDTKHNIKMLIHN